MSYSAIDAAEPLESQTETEKPYESMVRLVTRILRAVFVVFMLIMCGFWVYGNVSGFKKTEEARTNFHASCGTFATSEACNQLWTAVQQMIRRDLDEPQNWSAFACWLAVYFVCTVIITLLGPWEMLARLFVIGWFGDHVLSKLDKNQNPFVDSDIDSSNISDS